MERNLIQDAERIQELTEGRISFERATWIALYIQRITNGMTHEQAIEAEEQEKKDRGIARALIAEMEQPTGHPYKASTTGPLCEVCGERKINRYGTHGLPGLEQGDQQTEYKPQSKVGQYISCQYCHKPAGDRQTKENGYCQDCKAEIVSAGHERERLATGHA